MVGDEVKRKFVIENEASNKSRYVLPVPELVIEETYCKRVGVVYRVIRL